MLRFFGDQLTFFREFRNQFETTGAIAPSSSSLARSMTSFLAQRDNRSPGAKTSLRVLEIGPGTGPVTDFIVRSLREGDTFDLVELNPNFATMLRKKFQSNSEWNAVAGFSQIHEIPIQDFQATAPYDFIISGLPLNNFPADVVQSIVKRYIELLAPGGILSYFEYMYVRPLRVRIPFGDRGGRLKSIDHTMTDLCRQYRIRRDTILRNLPPAWVQHLQKPETDVKA
ncbi:MAG: class I SAM-dependent methyltransferase [Planctomyces sp.]